MTDGDYHQHVKDPIRAASGQAAGWPTMPALQGLETARFEGSIPSLLANAAAGTLSQTFPRPGSPTRSGRSAGGRARSGP